MRLKLTSAQQQYLLQEIARRRQEEQARKATFGAGRDILSAVASGQRLAFVGDRYVSVPVEAFPTFPHFLNSYLLSLAGQAWGEAEIAKQPEQRHQFVKWRDHMCRHIRGAAPLWEKDGKRAITTTGAFHAWHRLAYDLYLVEHNARFHEQVLVRLKDRHNFQGARYELMVAAAFAVAGFKVEYPDPRDTSRKLPDLITTHSASGVQIAVEAKSRHRRGVLGYEGPGATSAKESVGLQRLLRDAQEKETDGRPLLVFADLNLPKSADPVASGWVANIQEALQNDSRNSDKVTPAAAYFFTNDCCHYHLDEVVDFNDSTWSIASASSDPNLIVPDFASIAQLSEAFMQRSRIPMEFPSTPSVINLDQAPA